jgi:cytochrome b subunit of formate dehydrogenase
VADGGEPVTRYFVRFSRWQRLQHALVIVLFVLLCVTGLPQKYAETGWASRLIALLGGVDAARWLHRAAGLAFAGLLVAHVVDLLVRLGRGRASMAMVPHRKDISDALTTLRYYVGLGERQARFDRFDYKQKFEYWGMLLGSFIVVTTGLILLFPIEVTRWLPGSVIPVAVVAHGSEGLLAFLTIITWHIFNAALTPEVFPLDTSIFTGRISEERLRHEHPLEHERLIAADRSRPVGSDHRS